MGTAQDILLDKGSDVVGILATATIRQAVNKMVEANVGCVLAEMEGRIVGIFSERDLLRRVVDGRRNVETTTIAEVMSSPVEACQATDDLEDCARLLKRHEFRHLVVMDRDEPVGVISMRDLIGRVQPTIFETLAATAAR
jgi:CBS domain-containing protein